MTWTLHNSKVDIYGYLNFTPNVTYWLDSASTYRVVFIQVGQGIRFCAIRALFLNKKSMQNQASWFVVTGSNFVIDAHSQGGINGNGQVSAFFTCLSWLYN
jgi:galacturan 1,4-alpha-galacturonidase